MKFKNLYLTILIFVASDDVESACDIDIITKINSLWGDNAPKGVLDSLIGSLTYLYIPKVLKNVATGFLCIKTVLEEHDKETAIDYQIFEEDVKVVKYAITENELNITRSFKSEARTSDDYVFPVYLKNGVFGFWQCRDDYEAFVNIGVLNYLAMKDEEEVKDAISEAQTRLQQLGREFPPRSNC